MGHLTAANETSDWVQTHAALSRLSRERAALDAEEGRWLLCAWRSAAHLHLGYASFAQYVESLFGYKPRTIQEKLRVAEALETLPRLANALEGGALSWCAARELTPRGAPHTESTWLGSAGGRLDDEDPPRARSARREQLALARHVLGGPRDQGRSSYQISLHVCAVCGGGAQLAAGERVPVDAAVVDMAACDAQHLGELLPLVAAPRAANENAIPNADDQGRAGADDASCGERTTTHQSSSRAHVDAPDISPRPRAQQNIPPALRRCQSDGRKDRRTRHPLIRPRKARSNGSSGWSARTSDCASGLDPRGVRRQRRRG
jgi:hypothetical protein